MDEKASLVINAVIQDGTMIYHGGQTTAWPACKAPAREYIGETYAPVAKNPNIEFTCRLQGDDWTCYAPGYGDPQSFGHGPITILESGGIEPVPGQPNVIPISEIPNEGIRVQYHAEEYTYIMQWTRGTCMTLMRAYLVVGKHHAVKLDAADPCMLAVVYPLLDRAASSTIFIQKAASKKQATSALYYTPDGCKYVVRGGGIPLPIQTTNPALDINRFLGSTDDPYIRKLLTGWVERINGIDDSTHEGVRLKELYTLIPLVFNARYPVVV